MLDLSLLLTLAFAAFGIGSIISNRLHEREDISVIFSWGVETGLGLGSIAIFTFFLGMLKLLYWWLLWPIIIVAAVYGILSFRQLILKRIHVKLSISMIYIVPVLLLIPLIALVIIDYLAPANRYDDLKYHLAIPRLCVETHKLYPFSTTFHSYWPANLEMLITDVMMLGSDTGGRGVSFLLLLSLSGVLWGLTNQIHRKFYGIVPVLLLFTLPTVLSQVQVASSDLAGSVWMLGAIALLIVWVENYEPKFCLLSGVFMGFALGTKYNFMYEIAASVFIIFVYAVIFRRPFLIAKNIKIIIFSIFIAIAVGSPWYTRNWILTGNPVYPFYYSLFGGINWSEGLDKEFMIWLKSDYVRPPLSKVPSSLLKEGFCIFYLLPLCLISCRRPKQILIIFLVLANFLAWYYLGTYQLRFGITWQVLLTVAIAYGFLEITRYWKKFHYLIMPVLCVFLVWQLPGQYRSEKSRMKVVLGQQTKEEYLAENSTLSDIYPLIDYANKNLPDGTTLATFWHNAGLYYSKHEYYMLNPLVSGIIDHTVMNSPEEYAKAVLDTGATHLLYSSQKAKFFISPPRTIRYSKLHNWHEYFLRNHCKFLKRNKGAFLYEIIHEAGK